MGGNFLRKRLVPAGSLEDLPGVWFKNVYRAVDESFSAIKPQVEEGFDLTHKESR